MKSNNRLEKNLLTARWSCRPAWPETLFHLFGDCRAVPRGPYRIVNLYHKAIAYRSSCRFYGTACLHLEGFKHRRAEITSFLLVRLLVEPFWTKSSFWYPPLFLLFSQNEENLCFLMMANISLSVHLHFSLQKRRVLTRKAAGSQPVPSFCL